MKLASTWPSDVAGYAYDPAGNPVERAELGFEVTNAFNNLNQILSGSWTGRTITAVGAVNYPAGTVTVSGASGTIYADKTFDAAGVPVHFGVNYLTNVFTDIFGRSVTNATSVTITNRAYVHDANGNLTDDGVFQYQYDTANQLTNVVRTADGARVLNARYDALGRRVEATRADGSVERYVYFPGSFLVLAVLDGTNAAKEIYTRGPDLSGSLDGAGGIGGILAVTDSSSVARYYHADIMGNVIALTDTSGSVVSTFRYTPFGQLSARTGTILPRYLFSSKEFDRPANLYYYGYRYYAPRLGRWMTRDPLGEDGGINLFLFSLNSPLDTYDYMGLYPGEWVVDCFKNRHKVEELMEKARNTYYNEKKAYICCWKGKEVDMNTFFDPSDGEKTSHQVLHKLMGCEMREAGIPQKCMILANLIYEGKTIWKEWIKRPDRNFDDWLRDTGYDIAAVMGGYNRGGPCSVKRFKPPECTPRAEKTCGCKKKCEKEK